MTYNKQVYRILLISFIGFILCLILAVMVNSEVFLITDAQSKFNNDGGTLRYEVSFDNGQNWINADSENLNDNKIRLKHSLGSVPIGSHVMQVRAVNPWGVSSAVPFAFTKELPQSPTNIGLDFDTTEIIF